MKNSNSSVFISNTEDRSCIDDIENTINMFNGHDLLKSHGKVQTEFMIDYKGWERLERINQTS